VLRRGAGHLGGAMQRGAARPLLRGQGMTSPSRHPDPQLNLHTLTLAATLNLILTPTLTFTLTLTPTPTLSLTRCARSRLTC
jgi:hypothetical protein